MGILPSNSLAIMATEAAAAAAVTGVRSLVVTSTYLIATNAFAGPVPH
jgi:hypothetical protein